MSQSVSPPPRAVYPWWIVLCLVGLDYFSTLAYLPSIAMQYTRDLAPLTGVGVVLVTLLMALPVYLYVVGRSPHGKGGLGLLEERYPGWTGKLLVLALLGFVATDFIMTRTLSVADAATHILDNSWYKDRAVWFTDARDAVAGRLPEILGEPFRAYWTEQLMLTVFLSVLAFTLYFFLIRSLNRGFVGFAVGVVVVYLALNAFVILSAVDYLRANPDLVRAWADNVRPHIGDYREKTGGVVLAVVYLSLLSFPSLAIGLSGFELTMASAPAVKTPPGDDPVNPAGRILRTRAMMVVLAVTMSLLVVGANFVCALLVDVDLHLKDPATGEVRHRALAYLAHGGPMADGKLASDVNRLFGPSFGALYDLSTVAILCLAGAATTVSLKQVVPEFLGRFGMQTDWANRLNVISHLFNVAILVVTLYFRASVSTMLGAYAASVLALLFGASLAATLDVKHRLRDSSFRLAAVIPFALITLVFAVMAVLIVVQRPQGLFIAFVFIAIVLGTAILSRALRAGELRFEGFRFADDASKARWEAIRQLEFQVLIPHDPTGHTLPDKEGEIRTRHRLTGDVPLIFVEVTMGDASDFYQRPLMQVVTESDRDIIRVSGCTSIAHVLAAIALEFRAVGHPPELHFGWSNKSPLAATVDFLLMGQGNVPMLVRSIIRNAEPDAKKRPRVIVG